LEVSGLAAASLYGCVVHVFGIQKDIACRLRMSASSNALNEIIFTHNVAVSSIAEVQKSYNTNEKNTWLSKVSRIELFSDLFCCHE